MTTIGIIGAGNIGSRVARKAVDNGYDVVIANSRGPQTLADLVAELGPRARAATAREAAEAGDVAVVTIPLFAYEDVPVEPLADKVVLDTNNYYPGRDGQIAELDEHRASSSELLQRHLPTSRVVKAFNHIQAQQILDDATPPGTPGRRALVLYGDDDEAKGFVADLYDRFGFDPVDGGPLSESWRIEPDQPGYNVRHTADQIRADLAAAKR